MKIAVSCTLLVTTPILVSRLTCKIVSFLARLTVRVGSEKRNYYIAGGFQGGCCKEYLNACEKMKNMIDIGCGVGAFLYWFQKLMQGWVKYGIEPTSEFSEVASKETNAKIFNCEFKPGMFDFKFDLKFDS